MHALYQNHWLGMVGSSEKRTVPGHGGFGTSQEFLLAAQLGPCRDVRLAGSLQHADESQCLWSLVFHQ